MWFVAEDPVRNGKLPGNIAQVAQTIIDAAKRQEGHSARAARLRFAAGVLVMDRPRMRRVDCAG